MATTRRTVAPPPRQKQSTAARAHSSAAVAFVIRRTPNAARRRRPLPQSRRYKARELRLLRPQRTTARRASHDLGRGGPGTPPFSGAAYRPSPGVPNGRGAECALPPVAGASRARAKPPPPSHRQHPTARAGLSAHTTAKTSSSSSRSRCATPGCPQANRKAAASVRAPTEIDLPQTRTRGSAA
jgi:hypothetical protein